MAQDVFKILKDLESRAVGIDPQADPPKMQEGYFVSFRSVGLPIHKDDFADEWSPLAANLEKDIPKKDPVDPKNAPKTASGQIDENKIFAANIAKSQQAYLNTFLLTDDKLVMNTQWIVMPGASKVSDSWYAIITGANGIPTESVLGDTMKQAYEEAKAKLMDKDGNPTPHYQAYLKYEDEYKSKVRAWHKAYASVLSDPMKLQNWPIDGTSYQDDADEAMDRWMSFGFKEEIETAIDTLAAQGIDPAIALITRNKKRFINSLNEFTGIGAIPYTLLLPNSWYDSENDDGWTDYTSTDFHNESHYQASSTSYGGGGGVMVGLWHAGGSLNRTEQQSSLEIEGKDLEISFSYCVAQVERPWLGTSLLNLTNWFLMGDYKKNCISNGKMSQELPSQDAEPTFLPSVVTGLILIKDLSIKWANWKEDLADKVDSLSASANVGYGPFVIQGSYSHHGEKRDFTADKEGESLVVHGIQLIGYVSAINPASPGVDSSQFLAKKKS